MLPPKVVGHLELGLEDAAAQMTLEARGPGGLQVQGEVGEGVEEGGTDFVAQAAPEHLHLLPCAGAGTLQLCEQHCLLLHCHLDLSGREGGNVAGAPIQGSKLRQLHINDVGARPAVLRPRSLASHRRLPLKALLEIW